MKPFIFKHFSLQQDRCAMKIGTDGCLLGAWANGEGAKNVLDIGTGTGLIASMLAQRFPSARIDALELDAHAAEQALENCRTGPFADRIRVVHQDVLEWNEKGYDLIVCNPPFFEESSSSATGEARAAARQEDKLNAKTLMEVSVQLASETGKLAVVWPARRKELLLEHASISGWHVRIECSLFPTPEKECHRVLLSFEKTKGNTERESLIIEEFGRHQYSDAYKLLLKDFYLKF
ncbi:MAG: methyltransferase [Flavobacteriales bacterium]|nr:methyltransferase [Flavobacteriales bacterium]